MDPISALVTLVGLLCNWKQERGAVAQERFQDFMLWLQQHHYNDLRSRIIDSAELTRELDAFLHEDFQTLSSKLDGVSMTLTSIVSRIESLSGLAHGLNAKAEKLSLQAVQILKKAQELNASSFFVPSTDPQDDQHLIFEPSYCIYAVTEPWLLMADIQDLQDTKYLIRLDTTDDGPTQYALTRLGRKIAEDLPPNTNLLTQTGEQQNTFEPIMLTSGGR